MQLLLARLLAAPLLLLPQQVVVSQGTSTIRDGVIARHDTNRTCSLRSVDVEQHGFSVCHIQSHGGA